MNPEPLDGKEGYVDSWQIRDKKDVHPSHRTKVFEAKDIKSACDFYLRYKNNPELFEKEILSKEPQRYEDIINKLRNEWYNWEEHYDKWLFNLAFKDILGRSSKNE